MIANTDDHIDTICRTRTRPRCPECGGIMKAVEHTKENGYEYIWFVCSYKNCTGQWLEKVSAPPQRNEWLRYHQAAELINSV